MPSTQADYSEPTRIQDETKEHTIRITHNFWDDWAKILTPCEMVVFLSLNRYANFTTQNTDGWWNDERCMKDTGLNKRTVWRAMSALRQYGLAVVTPRNGRSGLIKINQDIAPHPGLYRKSLKTGKPFPRAGVSSTPAPGVSHTPAPGVSHTPAPGVSHTPAPPPPDTPAPGVSDTPRFLASEPLSLLASSSDDDDDKDQETTTLMNWYADRGILLEEEMARIHLENARLLRPDINVGELNLIARAKIAYVAKCKQGKGFTPYLMASVLNCLKGKEFDGYRKRWNEIQEEKKREQEENDRLKLYLEAHASEL